MLKRRKTVTASITQQACKPKFSMADVHYFLRNIKELNGCDITAAEFDDGTCDFSIGDTTYQLEMTDVSIVIRFIPPVADCSVM